MSEQNGWISIDDARFTLSKYVGDEIVIRTKANNGRWVYQIAIVDEDGKVVIDPCVMCSQCGGTLQWKPHTWNPFSKMPMEWKPLGKFIDADRSAANAKAHADNMYQRALKAEELLKRSLPYLEASLLGRLYSEMQGAHKNKALHKALEQECSDLETLIEEIRETI